MSILDEITKEKQRVTEALARVEAQREKLASQLVELEATERARNLAEYGKGRKPGGTDRPHASMRAVNNCLSWVATKAQLSTAILS